MKSPSVQNYYSVLRNQRQIIKQHVCEHYLFNFIFVCIFAFSCSIAFYSQKDSLGRLTTDMKRLKLLPQSWRPLHIAATPPSGQPF